MDHGTQLLATLREPVQRRGDGRLGLHPLDDPRRLQLAQAIGEQVGGDAREPVAQIRVPVGDGRLLAALHRDSEVMAEIQVDGVVEVTARVEAWLLGKLRREGVEVVLGGGL